MPTYILSLIHIFGHKRYRTHLTEKDLNGQIVHYLKPLDNIAPSEGCLLYTSRTHLHKRFITVTLFMKDIVIDMNLTTSTEMK